MIIKIELASGAILTIPVGMLRYLVPLLEDRRRSDTNYVGTIFIDLEERPAFPIFGGESPEDDYLARHA